MTDTEIKAKLDLLENRIHQLEQKIEHMADVGDTVEVSWPLLGHGSYVYERRNVVITSIEKAHREDDVLKGKE